MPQTQAATLATVLLAAAALLAPANARAEILIATAAPMTGRVAWSGEQYQRGAELAVEAVNAGGGLLGQRVELRVEDVACEDARGAAAEEVELAEDDGGGAVEVHGWVRSGGPGVRGRR